MSVLNLNDEQPRGKYKKTPLEAEVAAGKVKPGSWRSGMVSQTWRSRGLIQKGALSVEAIRVLDDLMDEALGDEAADAVEEMVAFIDQEWKPLTADRWAYVKRKILQAARNLRRGEDDEW